jgi:hypothetical protein
MLKMNGEFAKRSQEQSAAAEAERQRQAEIAAQNQENARRAVLGAILQNGGLFHPAPQPYMMPTQPPPNIRNCQTIYTGNFANTNCQ